MKRGICRVLGWAIGCAIGFGFAMPLTDGGGLVVLLFFGSVLSIPIAFVNKPVRDISVPGLVVVHLIGGLAMMIIGGMILKSPPPRKASKPLSTRT